MELTERDYTAHITVLSGDIDKNDTTDVNGVVTSTAGISGSNAYHVVYSKNVNAAQLDGFMVTAGAANFSGSCPGSWCGGMLNLGEFQYSYPPSVLAPGRSAVSGARWTITIHWLPSTGHWI